MADAVRKLSVRLSVDNAQRAKAELREVGESGHRSLQQIVTGASAASAALRLLGPVIAGLGVSALAATAKRALDTAGGLGELAEQLGVSTDALQAYQFAAGQAGVSSEQLEAGLSKLTRAIGEAADGNAQAIDAFTRLGIGVLDAGGNVRSTEAVLADIADAIAKVENPAERARIAFEFLGRSGQRMVPLLAGGRDALREMEEQARRTGQVLDAELIKQADEASDALGAMAAQAQRLFQRLVAFAAPTVMAGLREINRLLGNESAGERTAGIDRQIAQLTEGLERPGVTAQQRENVQAIIDDLRQERAAIAAAARGPAAVAPDPARGTRNPRPRQTGSGAAERPDPGALERRLNELAQAEGVIRVTNEQLAEGQRIFEQTRTPAELYAQTVARLGELLRTGATDQDTYNRAIDEANATLASATRETDDLAEAAQQLGLTFSSAFEDAILRGARLRDLLQGIAQDIARIIVRQTITQPLAGGITGLISQAGSLLGSLFTGGPTAAPDKVVNLNGGFKAEGGPVSRGMNYVVGEQGPELFVPSAAGTIVPAGRFGGGGPVVNQSYTIDARGADAGSEARLRALVPQIIAAARDGTLDAIRRGGYAFRTARG